MLTVTGSLSAALRPLRARLFAGSFSTSHKVHKANPKSKKKDPSAPHDLDPFRINSPEAKVLMSDVKEKVLEILEREGPLSRQKIFQDFLSKVLPVSPFTPNPPPRPIWMRTQYTPQEEKVFLTMTKYKRHLIRSLKASNLVSVMTVFKVRRLLAEIEPDETRPEVLERKAKMEKAIETESDKTFVWILERWVAEFKQKYVRNALAEAEITGRAVASRFKAACILPRGTSKKHIGKYYP